MTDGERKRGGPRRGLRARHTPRPNNDIEALAMKVPGFAAQRYVDEQEAQAARAAATRWPRLAGWLGYGEDGEPEDHAFVDAPALRPTPR
ncbi:hypothetical protein [Cupriavidus gilardii]|uniref:Uncharacterized protein n=1 Tax=Cupriavidus gilardii TaxID=82541 RepID=A0ABY4VV63_9BURK|nr:hypothetical protein [Cupriavidus gilardii]QQE06057.1 hypothetical protein IC580_09425 [Cupriavidus sp. ISTL7]MCT9072395.1 hypothetical protein [Cupriavidus gilardii]QKS64017.1 hypothetical protein FOB47_19525 [Cupriavidus gilardii]USE81181.1 hypothetical protein NDR89_15805 [Cupriavidus gilardii]UXC37075.1 hypothetical protein N4G38_06390 [Cupriavidus gilardii]